MLEWTSRPATKADKRALFELRKDHLLPYVETSYGWDERAQRAFFEEDWRRDRALTVVVERAGEVVAAYRAHGRFLISLEVTPRLRGQGLGAEILRSLMETREEIVVEVTAANEGARRFYLANGFVSADNTLVWRA